MRVFRQIQSLPSNFYESGACEDYIVDRNDMPELKEETSSYPQEIQIEIKRENLGNSVNHQSTKEQHSHQRTLPRPIPCDPQSREAEREEKLHQELVHVYNDATWKMYYRIQNARRSRCIEQRDRSRSEGLI